MELNKFIILILAIAGTRTFAVVPCRQEPRAIEAIATTEENLKLIPVMDIDDPDRLSESQKARQEGKSLEAIERRYAATGKIQCGMTSIATGELTIRNNTLVTAAHVFFNDQTCAPLVNPKSCVYSTTVNGRKVSSRIKSILKTGYGSSCAHQRYNDWAVVELEHNINGVEPYGIGSRPELLRQSGFVTTVHALDADLFTRNSSGHAVYHKTIGFGQIKKIYSYHGNQIYFTTNADSAGFSSGGAILDDNGERPVLVGIHVAGTETDDQLGRAIQNGHPNHCRFNEQTCANAGVPIQGELREFLESLSPARRAVSDESGISI